jgi:signal peptidase II
MKLSKGKVILSIILLILVVDQVLKFWIKTNMALGDEFLILGNWFIIHFVENNGMAFGFEFAGEYGKMFLSIFRIIAVTAIGWYLVKMIKQNESFGFLVSIALIFTGAMGNIIDSVFYGMLFDHSYGQVAAFLPEGGGYSSFLHGKVVDMFYFPIITGTYPEWFPFWAGNEFIFFRPVFNIADSSITVGIFMILLFHRHHFDEKHKSDSTGSEEKDVKPEEATVENTPLTEEPEEISDTISEEPSEDK